MRNYQLVLVLKTSLSDTERKKLLDLVKSWLKDVKIIKEEEWGQKPLSFKIRRENSGLYYNYWLESESVIPLDFEKKLFAHEDVLRHLLIKSKPKEEIPAEKEQKKEVKKAEVKKETKKEEKPKKGKLIEAKSAIGGKKTVKKAKK